MCSNICVLEYPRSGGNWLLKMLSQYFNIPYRDRDKLPESPMGRFLKAYFSIPPLARFNQRIGWNPFSYLIKTHILENIADTAIYVVRDPRDAIVSYYFFERVFLRLTNQKSNFFFNVDIPIKKDFERYLRYRYESSDFPYANWPEHVSFALRKGLYIVKYEDMLLDTSQILTNLLHNYGTSIDDDKLQRVVNYQRFTSEKTRLRRSDSILCTHLRTGQSGSWKKYFTQSAHDYLIGVSGRLMTQLGYVY